LQHVVRTGKTAPLELFTIPEAICAKYRQDVEASARACVEEGGGIWVGIQEEEGMLYDLVLFNSLKTGSTLALKTTEITPEKVRRQIKNSNEKFRRALTK
jgi:hypothetical protein